MSRISSSEITLVNVLDGDPGADGTTYAELSRDDKFAPLESTSTSLTAMSTGSGDYFTMSTTGSVTLNDNTETMSSTALMYFNNNTSTVNYFGILSPDEDNVNAASQLASLSTIKAGISQLAYSYNGNKAIYNVTEVLDTISFGGKTLYTFKVSHVSGSFLTSGTDGINVTIEVNYQLKGSDGTSGERGAGLWRFVTSSDPSTLTSAQVSNIFFTETGFTQVIGERVVIAHDTGSYDAKAWIWDGSVWQVQAEFIDGNLLVQGTVTSNAIAANSISADKLNVTSLDAVSSTIGTFQSAASGERIVISDDKIQVFDANNVLRVVIGNLT
jgi:hypothetical protein